MSEHNPSCPISGQMVNSRAAQINALMVFALIILAIAFSSLWPVAIMIVEFGIRVFVGYTKSPFSVFTHWTVKRLGLAGDMTDAAPKRFAAGMGLAFAVTGLVFAVLGMWTAFSIVLGVFGFCALLEGLFGLCLGCRIYALLPASLRGTPARRIDGTT